jgi:hypothetical protein
MIYFLLLWSILIFIMAMLWQKWVTTSAHLASVSALSINCTHKKAARKFISHSFRISPEANCSVSLSAVATFKTSAAHTRTHMAGRQAQNKARRVRGKEGAIIKGVRGEIISEQLVSCSWREILESSRSRWCPAWFSIITFRTLHMYMRRRRRSTK